MIRLDAPRRPSNFETPAIWTQVAEDYTELLLPLFERCAKHALGLVELQSTMRVLDLACGPGTLSLPLRERVASMDAVDFSPRMLDCLRRRSIGMEPSGLHCHLMDGHQLGFDEAHFDAAFSMFGVVHFADPGLGLSEMHRVLRPGASMVVATWAAPRESSTKHIAALAELGK